MPRHLGLCIWLVALACNAPAASAETFPPPKRLGDTNGYGRHLQRTMTLLATSTPSRRHTVKVLFYGQSITEQGWTRRVADDLRRRFPHAQLVIENRAIGGHPAQLLVKTAEADLYPFYPDLVIFHVYGSHLEYEKIIRHLRQRTTAEILMQTDHLTQDSQLTEETDPAKLTPKQWDAFMNHAFLPATARKYGAELCDQRTLWKYYLQDYGLSASNLLRDAVHLNAHGEYLMAECVKAYLRYDPSFPADAWTNLVTTYQVGSDVHWRDGRLVLDFEGNRVDLVVSGRPGGPVRVRIDGRKPSDFPELYGFTRTSPYPGANWPCLLRVGSQHPLQLEEWTLTLKEISPDHQTVRFVLGGTRTGADGEGTNTVRFVSRSGRVVLEPEDWNLAYAFKVFRRPLPPGFQIRWRVASYFADEFVPRISQEAQPHVLTVAQGLSHGPHRLELIGDSPDPLAAIPVYRPPLQ